MMERQADGGSGGRQGKKRWPLFHGHRFLAVLLLMSMIHVATSQNKMSSLDQGLDKIRSPRYAQTAGKTNTQSSRTLVCDTKQCKDVAEQIKRTMNLSVDPCDDFFEYACGKWPMSNPMPDGYSFFSWYEFAELKLEDFKKRKIETGKITVNGASKELEKMPSTLYNSCMNLTAIENLGSAPLEDRIRDLNGWTLSGNWDENTWDFNKTILSIHNITSGGPVFKLGIVPSNNKKKTLFILQAEPVLKKEQYLNLTSKTMLAYKQLIVDVVRLLGGDANTAPQKAEEIIGFEAQLANASLTFAKWNTLLHIFRTLDELEQEVPEFDWTGFLNKLGAPFTFPRSEPISLPTLSYLKKAMKIIQTTSKSVLANYMVWYVIQSEINWLSTPFRNASLTFRKVAKGITADKKHQKKCLDSAFNSFKDVITAAYVNEYHAELSKGKNMASSIMGEVTDAFKENIKPLTWLDDATESEVIQKVDGMGIFLGYPDYLLDGPKMASLFKKYDGLTIRKETYYQNKVSMQNNAQKILEDYRKPKDNTLWPEQVSPLKSQALAFFTKNEFYFTVTMLQSPFLFPDERIRAYNMGNFGFVAAHEMMHGFGINGRPFDKDGKQRNWWTNSSLREFNKRLKCYEDQYSKYKILGKWPIDGKRTSEENVADSGALKIAIKAYYDWQKKPSSVKWKLHGLNFTNEELFYIGVAQHLCSNATLKYREDINLSGKHIDDKFRVIGMFSNSCEFANVFKCKKYSPMNPIKKCYLWSKEGPLV